MKDGRHIKLKITKYKNKQYITGVITTNREGLCFKSLLHDNDIQLTPKIDYQPKNGICAVFVAWK